MPIERQSTCSASSPSSRARPAGRGAADVLVVDEQLHRVGQPVDGRDPERREQRRPREALHEARPSPSARAFVIARSVRKASGRDHDPGRGQQVALADHQVREQVEHRPVAAQGGGVGSGGQRGLAQRRRARSWRRRSRREHRCVTAGLDTSGGRARAVGQEVLVGRRRPCWTGGGPRTCSSAWVRPVGAGGVAAVGNSVARDELPSSDDRRLPRLDAHLDPARRVPGARGRDPAREVDLHPLDAGQRAVRRTHRRRRLGAGLGHRPRDRAGVPRRHGSGPACWSRWWRSSSGWRSCARSGSWPVGSGPA